MTNHGRNEGLHILDDLVFEPTYDPAVHKPDSPRQAQNEGVRVVEEMVIDFQQGDEEDVRILEEMVIDLKEATQLQDAQEERESPPKKIEKSHSKKP
jgi:hypothetical protein